ncbi:glycosyltransferase [Ferruginibacter albus]|uniref:glycosyltransferase n=1 Tax=Ferruginibacter albus TaxID=2875540 RepID=UPI001CC3CE88|nr:glycosyltransferase [Ferruginibacter albus]UAY52233.1 glycosyltransferase [Ferruginibacter albus]
MKRKTIVIVINDLGAGGAEKLVTDLLPGMNNAYKVILVTLNKKGIFDVTKTIVCEKSYCLNFKSNLSIPRCALQLKRIIKGHQPDLVHSHLFHSSLIARIACPADIPLVFTIHGALGYEVFSKNVFWRFIENATVRKYHSVIAVAEHLLEDYEKYIKRVNKRFVVPNCISDEFFETKPPSKNYNQFTVLKMVAVGNIKPVKNYAYLVEAFKKLQNVNITLDIYGIDQGGMTGLQKEIDDNQLPIIFKGVTTNVSKILPDYNMYVMPSKSEGCSVAVMEAMIIGLPLLLSALPGLKAETQDNAVFFDIADEQSFIDRITEIVENKYDLNDMSVKGIEIATENYTQSKYFERLFAIYETLINS